MAVKRSGPISGRSPSLLPMVKGDHINIDDDDDDTDDDDYKKVSSSSTSSTARKIIESIKRHQPLPMLMRLPSVPSNNNINNNNNANAKNNYKPTQPPNLWKNKTERHQTPFHRRALGMTTTTNKNTSNNKKLALFVKRLQVIPMDLVLVISVWYLLGVLCICTTKILVMKTENDGHTSNDDDRNNNNNNNGYIRGFGLPPLVLTIQQLIMGSSMLRLYLSLSGGLQPLPATSNTNSNKKKDKSSHRHQMMMTTGNNSISSVTSNSSTSTTASHRGSAPAPQQQQQQQQQHQQQYSIYYDFVLMGLFNALDFLASNTSFSHSAASFVETIKASEPLTTMAIALFFGIDRLRSTAEALSIVVLMMGVFCATMGNVEESTSSSTTSPTDNKETIDPLLVQQEQETMLHESIKTCVIVMTANICFALRAKSQKLFRSQPEGKLMDDVNLLMRIQQIGALSLILPLLFFELPGIIQRSLDTPFARHRQYWSVATTNAFAFASYCWASCYVLTKLSVVQHAGLGCLRRMFAIVFTSVAFGVPITPLGGIGIVLCCCGFSSFTHFRYQATATSSASKTPTTTTSTTSPGGGMRKMISTTKTNTNTNTTLLRSSPNNKNTTTILSPRSIKRPLR